VKGKNISLEEAFTGKNTSTRGVDYGKIRADVTILGAIEDYGSSYGFFCEVIRPMASKIR
jgi:hypothetical protein